MSAVVDPRPTRDVSWVLGQSNPLSLAVMALGVAGLALVTVGVLVVLALNGFVPVENLIRGFRSNDVTGIGVTTISLGVLAMAGGWGTYRRMPTKVSREQAVAGAVLGIQATFLGGLLIYFSEGNVDIFAINFFNFDHRFVGRFSPGFFVGIKNTVIMAVSGEFFGIVLGVILAVFAISKRAVVRAPARAYINFFRGTPLVWQIIMIGSGIPLAFALDIGPYTAMIFALSLNAGAYTAEVFRAGIQSIERGQLEAARGLGMSYMQAMRYSILPQAIRRVVPPLMNEFVILIKDTSLIIVLGLTKGQRDIMMWGDSGIENTFNHTFLIMVALGYLAISLPSIRLVNILERRLRSGLVGVGA
ncbi:MAG: amino acid ABC transporter permease [Actinomycetota bacterium]